MEVSRERGILLGWLLFYLWAFLLGALLFVPGMVWFSRLNAKPHLILALAPSFSIIVLTIAMTATELAGWRVPWYGYVILLTVLSALGVWVNRSNMRQYFNRGASSSSTAPLYIAVSLVLVTWIYVKNLDGLNSFAPLHDNASTLSTIQSFSDSNTYGPLLSSVYFDSNQLFAGLSYYPAVLHSLAALVSSMSGCGAAEALNIVTFDILFLLLPLSVRALIKAAFPDNRETEMLGAISPFVFYAFPWNLLSWGPLVTNLLGFSLVPAALAALIRLLDCPKSNSKQCVCLALSGLITVALCHPSALFTVGVLSIPLLVKSAVIFARTKNDTRMTGLIGAFLALVAIVLVWVLCYKLPFLNSTVSFVWHAFESPSESLASAISLSFADATAQPIAVAIVGVGVFSCLRRRESSSWLVADALLMLVMYCIDASTDGPFKQLIGGFWYTDSRRIASMLVIPLMPIFSFGLGRIYIACMSYCASMSDTKLSPSMMAYGIVLLITFISFGPGIDFYGFVNLPSAISFMRTSLASLYSLDGRLQRDGEVVAGMIDREEYEAGSEIANITSNGGLVLNNALDGSVFYYPAFGVNVVFRTGSSGQGDDSGSVLAKHIASYMSDPDTMELVKSCDIRYVLQLDSGSFPSEESSFEPGYNPSKWIGIQSVRANTPGFELIYSKGDIKLYRLTGI